ncbi:MAG: PorV/PorQ family protein [Calditrichae bacterium]|nr:PorV/PorQ family protein [Calditrichota bacterium]MCB9057625.1 PorV/PorQ family protein [Calditrichia bacterium]
MKNVYKIVLLVLIFGGLLNAQSGASADRISKVGTTAGQFLKIGVSARALAMGSAFTSVANDVSSIYWNPAGLSRVNAHEAMFTHVEWIANTSYDFGALTIHMGDDGALGLMVSSFSSGDMAVTTVEQPDGTGEYFSAQFIAAGISYSRDLTDKFSIGFTGKFVSETIWHMSASALALDVGTLFTTPIWGIQLGATISNFGSKMKLEGRDTRFAYDPLPNQDGPVEIVNSGYEMLEYSLPLRFQVGISKDLEINEYNRLTIAADAIQPNDNYESVNTGFEYAWKEMFFLRAGYKSLFQEDSEEGMTLGMGANIRLAGTTQIRVDYAYADMNRLENAQKFSLAIRF